MIIFPDRRAARHASTTGRAPVLARLRKWLDDNGLSQSEAAARAGLCTPVFNRILNRRNAASKAAGFAIQRLTEGTILADDLFRVVPTPAASHRRYRAKRDAGRRRKILDKHPRRNLGPFRDEAAALSFLVGRLTTALRPEAILLFGSRAAADARPDSDFDLLVVLPDDTAEPPDHFSAYAPIAGSGLGVDIVPCRLADYLDECNQPGSIAHAATHHGRILYVRPGSPLRESRRPKLGRL